MTDSHQTNINLPKAEGPELKSYRDTDPVPLQGELVPFTRIADLSQDLPLIKLDDIQNQDLIIFRYDKYHSNENDADFLTLECASLYSPEQRFLTNCGGTSAMERIVRAFELIEQGKAVPPLVASFHKGQTASGRAIWLLR